MTSYNDPKTRREIIMDHYLKPLNKVDKVENGISVYSKACVDELHLDLKWDNDKLIDAKFSGVGCAVFISSTDIVLSLIKNKTKAEIKDIIINYKNLINNNGNFDREVLGEAQVFENVNSHLNRLHCAEMIQLGLEKAL